MKRTTAGALKPGDRIIWFDSRENGMKTYRVIEHSVVGGRVRGRVKMVIDRYGKKPWAGPAKAEIVLPTNKERDI